MNIEKLKQKDVQEFIHAHKSVDITELSFKKIPYEGELRAQILQQISALQKAQKKIPEWTTRTRLIFPNADLVEQASSDLTANYKASIYPQENIQCDVFIDLCAGLGRDAYAFSKKFITGFCVEADPEHAKCLEYNLKSLGANNLTVLTGYAANLLQTLPKADLIYLDPQRRTDTGKRGLFDLSQTLPDILELLPAIKEKSPRILIKTSPYLDITEGLKQLGDVAEVHVVGAGGQCKEVLFFIDQTRESQETDIIAAECRTQQCFRTSRKNLQTITPEYSEPLKYLYEPSPSLMKSALHVSYANAHALKKLSLPSHLYTSGTPKSDYMGRSFEIIDILPVKKSVVQDALPDKKANITVRGFPLKAEDLRKKLQIKEGGNLTLFACTLQNGDKRLILCQK